MTPYMKCDTLKVSSQRSHLLCGSFGCLIQSAAISRANTSITLTLKGGMFRSTRFSVNTQSDLYWDFELRLVSS